MAPRRHIKVLVGQVGDPLGGEAPRQVFKYGLDSVGIRSNDVDRPLPCKTISGGVEPSGSGFLGEEQVCGKAEQFGIHAVDFGNQKSGLQFVEVMDGGGNVVYGGAVVSGRDIGNGFLDEIDRSCFHRIPHPFRSDIDITMVAEVIGFAKRIQRNCQTWHRSTHWVSTIRSLAGKRNFRAESGASCPTSGGHGSEVSGALWALSGEVTVDRLAALVGQVCGVLIAEPAGDPLEYGIGSVGICPDDVAGTLP